MVEAVAQSGKRSALRPGREASIIRRLLARHHGALPPHALYRIWRELLAATTAMQGGFVLAVCDPHPGAAYTQLAREQYGALTPLRAHHSPSQAIGELSGGGASVAVLPLPSETEGWWTALLHPDIHVVARLPFWTCAPRARPTCRPWSWPPFPPDPSEQDRSLIGLELEDDVSRAKLTAAADRGWLRRRAWCCCAAIQARRRRMRWSRSKAMSRHDDTRLDGAGRPRAARSCWADMPCRWEVRA